MFNVRLLPYKLGSESGKALADVLNITRVRPDGRYVPKRGHSVINWGLGSSPDWAPTAYSRQVTIINKPDAVNVAGNKLLTLKRLYEAGIRTPEFTTNVSTARAWLDFGFIVFERHELRGNSGKGIRVVERATDLRSAPLYTKYIPKTREYRVHVFDGQVIDFVQKKRTREEQRTTDFNDYISSVHHGWVFQRTNVELPSSVSEAAIKSIQALGLDFGAVDIIYYDDKPFVLEVNTAPGLQGVTLVRYANAFRRKMGLSDLSDTVVRQILGQNEESMQYRPAAVVASVGNYQGISIPPRSNPVSSPPQTAPERHAMDVVTLTLDRATALKLKQLLAQLV